MPCKRGYAARKLKEKRRFNGQNYTLSSDGKIKSKSDAKRHAKAKRARGFKVRIVYHKHHKEYTLYTRRK